MLFPFKQGMAITSPLVCLLSWAGDSISLITKADHLLGTRMVAYQTGWAATQELSSVVRSDGTKCTISSHFYCCSFLTFSLLMIGLCCMMIWIKVLTSHSSASLEGYLTVLIIPIKLTFCYLKYNLLLSRGWSCNLLDRKCHCLVLHICTHTDRLYVDFMFCHCYFMPGTEVHVS